LKPFWTEEIFAPAPDLDAIMHDVTRFHTCVERASGRSDRLIGVM
jgi:hypothetical protein